MSPERALDIRAKIADYERQRRDAVAPSDEVDDVFRAFIDILDGKDTLPQETLTLRDRFAMAALTGLLATPGADEDSLAVIVEESYRHADAMLKARKIDDEE